MCMADDSFGRRIPFIFLQDLKEKFLSTYGKNRALEAPPYGLNEFSRVIEKQMVKEKKKLEEEWGRCHACILINLRNTIQVTQVQIDWSKFMEKLNK